MTTSPVIYNLHRIKGHHAPANHSTELFRQSIYFLFLLILYIIQSTDCYHSNTQNDKFHEDLYLTPLDDGKLLAHFQFTTFYRKDIKSLRWENEIEILPLSIVDLVATTDLHKLHFGLTKGNWNYKNAGYQTRSSPPGAQIRAEFSKHNENLQRSWQRLVNLLGGKFCASLASADAKTVVSTKLAFNHQHLMSQNHTSGNHNNILYANLPEETFCTENLTPWKKLLPCYSNSGIASLLNAVNLLKSSYSSLSIDLEPIQCTDDDGDLIVGCEQVQLILSLSVVFNPLIQFEGKQTWSLAKIFGNPVVGQCSLSAHSQIHVDTTSLDDINKLYPQELFHEVRLGLGREKSAEKRYAVFDLKALMIAKQHNTTKSAPSNEKFNLGVKQSHMFKRPPLSARPILPIYLRTHVAGLGTSAETIVATVSNTLNEPIRVTYMHVLPYFLRVYLHTLAIRTRSNEELKPDKLNFVLSKDETPTLIEFSLILPANSETQISYDFERAFLRWTEFKPDANKGILLGSAMIGVAKHSVSNHLVNPLCCSSSGSRFRHLNRGTNDTAIQLELVEPDDELLRIYARPLLIILPTPDFSMPYNVLCLVSTVLVAAIGPLHNMTTRKPVIRADRKRKSDSNDDEEKEEETKKDK